MVYSNFKLNFTFLSKLAVERLCNNRHAKRRLFLLDKRLVKLDYTTIHAPYMGAKISSSINPILCDFLV